MEGTREGAPPETGGRHRWLFAYAINGDLRFISHHDTLRLFRRALARASVPVRYSEGFNPHPKVVIPLPRPVGISSQAETIVVETQLPIDPHETLRQLQQHTPQGVQMLSVRSLSPQERLRPASARYFLETEGAPGADVQARVESLRASASLVVERMDHETRKARSVDIRPFLMDLCATEEGVEFTLKIEGQASAKPAEVAGLLGFDASTINHRIRRLSVQWQ